MRGGVWIASYVMLWIAVLVLTLAVVALLRQIGVLHTRLRPTGVHFGGEGPPLDSRAPLLDRVRYEDAILTVIAFTKLDCDLCAALRPGLRAIEGHYAELQVTEVNHDDGTAPTFRAFNVASTPYVVAVDGAGIVRGRGIANSLEQMEVLVEEALENAAR